LLRFVTAIECEFLSPSLHCHAHMQEIAQLPTQTMFFRATHGFTWFYAA
jgi:hypothetical protein